MKNLAILLCLILLGCTQPDSERRYDLLIVNGTVYDGSNSAPRVGNLGIVNGRIVSSAANADAFATTRVDAAGLAVVPGFIDPHTHALDDLKGESTRFNLNYLAQGVTTVVVGNDGGGVPDFADTLATLTSQGIGTHVAFYAGHNDIREIAMGLENRPPSEAELEHMQSLVEEQMRAGAIGFSTGLYYTPGSYADIDEVVELAKVAAPFGGVYDTHMRDESSYSIGLLGAVEESIEIAERARIPLHIAHLKALGLDVWGLSGDVIARVEAARERGVVVTADQYPFRASGTRFESALIPAWVRADSDDAMFARIANADLADGIRAEMEENLRRRGGPGSLLVTGDDSRWRGQTLEQIAETMGVDPIDAAVEVVRGGDPRIASFNMNVDDIQAIALQEWVMTGSDGTDGHPRKYASYPTVYRDMVLEAGLFPVQRFVHRSSGLVADTLNLCDRGYLREGRRADIVVIDLETYDAIADFENPAALSTGVVHALIDGEFAIRDSEPTDVLAGEVVHRQELDCPDN